MRAISPAAERSRRDSGFALYELILALAIMGMVASLVLPHLVRPPGPVELRDSAREIAAILRNDRNTALARQRDVVTSVDVDKGVVRSGVTGRTVQMPYGIKIKLVQSSRELGGGGTGIRFRAGGGSSGGELTLSRQGFAYRISVNWLTASVRVAEVGARG